MGTGQHCVGMDTKNYPGKWIDQNCDKQGHFTCRMDISEYSTVGCGGVWCGYRSTLCGYGH